MPPFLAKGLMFFPVLVIFAHFGAGWAGLVIASIFYLVVYR